jgi:hypothetical protein
MTDYSRPYALLGRFDRQRSFARAGVHYGGYGIDVADLADALWNRAARSDRSLVFENRSGGGAGLAAGAWANTPSVAAANVTSAAGMAENARAVAARLIGMSDVALEGGALGFSGAQGANACFTGTNYLTFVDRRAVAGAGGAPASAIGWSAVPAWVGAAVAVSFFTFFKQNLSLTMCVVQELITVRAALHKQLTLLTVHLALVLAPTFVRFVVFPFAGVAGLSLSPTGLKLPFNGYAGFAKLPGPLSILPFPHSLIIPLFPHPPILLPSPLPFILPHPHPHPHPRPHPPAPGRPAMT